MKLLKVIAVGMLTIVTASSNAAVEYLRIAGVASENCAVSIDGECEFSLAQFGLVEGQFLYMDLVIDTEVNDFSNPDSSFQDYFFSLFLGGTEILGVDYSSVPVAASVTFPEGTETQFRGFGADLALGTRVYDFFSGEFENVGIDTWEVGTSIDLLFTNSLTYQELANASIGDLQLVYRSSTPPPAVVPLPASIWLLLSVFGGMKLFSRKH